MEHSSGEERVIILQLGEIICWPDFILRSNYSELKLLNEKALD